MAIKIEEMFQDLTPEETAALLEELDIGLTPDEDDAAIGRIQDAVLAKIKPQKRAVWQRPFPIAMAAVACLAVVISSVAIWRQKTPQLPIDPHQGITTTTQPASQPVTTAPQTKPAETNPQIVTNTVPVTQATQTGTAVTQTVLVATQTIPVVTQTIPVVTQPPQTTISPVTQATVVRTTVGVTSRAAIVTTQYIPPSTHPLIVETTVNHTQTREVIGGGGNDVPKGDDSQDDSGSSGQGPSGGNSMGTTKFAENGVDGDETTTTTTTTVFDGANRSVPTRAADANHDGLLTIADTVLLMKESDTLYRQSALVFTQLGS